MIHITKTKKGKFMVVTISSKNKKVLSTSEVLNSKQSCYKNIAAQCDERGVQIFVTFQDDTTKNPKTKRLFTDTDGGYSIEPSQWPTEAAYVPK